jgi:hypothetical protein
MDVQSRNTIINSLEGDFNTLMEQYNLDRIGVYEEEGKDNLYYMGYTVVKDGKTYMLSTPYSKDNNGQLSSKNAPWTLQAEDGEKAGYQTIHDILSEIH